MARSRLEKVFSYRLPLASTDPHAAALSVADWWDGFEFVTGPVMVFWKSKTVGTLEVWAVSEAEGRGVILHALDHMKADPGQGEWRVAHVTNKRFGKSVTMRATMVSTRDSSDGKPYAVVLDHKALKNENPALAK